MSNGRPVSTGSDETGESGRPPLTGLCVVELAHVMAGPVCGRMLADMGADVVKVERVDGGDDSRRFVPPTINGESAAFMMLNRNKRGIAVDLKTEAGREAVLRLIDRADVVVENFRSGTMEKLGLGYETLVARNPGLIYCEISGFGRTGPLAHLGGFDLIAQGYSGLLSVTGEGPGRPPVKCGPPLTDITAGILGAMGVLAALVHRVQTGRGQRVDTSLFEAGVTQMYWQAAIALATGDSPGPLGSAHPLSSPYQAFETSDGWITLGAASQASWERLPAVVGLPHLSEDERFRENRDRMANLDALLALLTPKFREDSTGSWLMRLEEAGIPAGPVASVGDMLEHPQTRARDMVREVEHAVAGTVETLGFPVKFSETPAMITTGAPVLGQHTREVLGELDYSSEEVDAMLLAGAVVAWDESRLSGG